MGRILTFLNKIIVESSFLFREPVVWIVFPLVFLSVLFKDCGGV